MVLVEPKTARSRRTVHLANSTITALLAHRSAQAELQLAVGPEWQASGLIFTSLKGGPMEGHLANEHLKKALRAAGLPNVRVHDLRHTAASLMMERGVHPKLVQEFLGHSSISLTLDTYSHIAAVMHGQIADEMESLFGR